MIDIAGMSLFGNSPAVPLGDFSTDPVENRTACLNNTLK
jgi:hypothetical protein